MPKNYIDLRIVIEYQKDGDSRFPKDAHIKIRRTKGLTPAEVSVIAEIFGDSDRYQEMLVHESIEAIGNEGERLENKEWEDRKNGLIR